MQNLIEPHLNESERHIIIALASHGQSQRPDQISIQTTMCIRRHCRAFNRPYSHTGWPNLREIAEADAEAKLKEGRNPAGEMGCGKRTKFCSTWYSGSEFWGHQSWNWFEITYQSMSHINWRFLEIFKAQIKILSHAKKIDSASTKMTVTKVPFLFRQGSTVTAELIEMVQ